MTGDLYHADHGGFLGNWLPPEAMAARVVQHCIACLPGSERAAVAVDLVREARSLRFAAACYSWMRAFGSSRNDGTAPLTEEEEGEVAAALGARLDSEHRRQALYRWEPSSERRALLEWWGITLGQDHTSADLARRFAAAPGEAVESLLPFRSHGWMVESGLPTPDMVSQHDYEAAVHLADPEVLMAPLQQLYGQELGTDDQYRAPTFGTEGQATAHQFARQYRLALDRAARAAEGAIPGPDEPGDLGEEAPPGALPE